MIKVRRDMLKGQPTVWSVTMACDKCGMVFHNCMCPDCRIRQSEYDVELAIVMAQVSQSFLQRGLKACGRPNMVCVHCRTPPARRRTA